MIQTCCWCLIDGFDETRSFEFPLSPGTDYTSSDSLSLQRARQSGTAFPVPSVPVRSPPPSLFPFFPIREGNSKEQSKGRTNGPLFHVIVRNHFNFTSTITIQRLFR